MTNVSEPKLPWPAFYKQAFTLGAAALFVAAVAACSSSTSVPEDGGIQDLTTPGEGQLSVEFETPEFDSAAFAEINPDPEIRELDYSVDRAFAYVDYERDRIPRDAISPVYSPAFVSPDEASLRPEEIVMGLAINGDARAYPVGIMRVREMVNDEVGGTPVLVTW